jgi:ubiquinol oxidase
LFRFVGYLEEEAVVTYTDILRLLDTNQLPMWKNLPAPPIAVRYNSLIRPGSKTTFV